MLHLFYFSVLKYFVVLIWLQYTILDDGCVCMEFFRVIGGTATVLEVMHISADGLQVKFVCFFASFSHVNECFHQNHVHFFMSSSVTLSYIYIHA